MFVALSHPRMICRVRFEPPDRQNCNPETELCMKSATTTASKWLSTTWNKTSRYSAPAGTGRNFSCPNASWCRGCDVEYAMNIAPEGTSGSGCALLTPPISHFCSQNGVNSGVEMSHAQAPHQPYKNPAGALFSAMHGGSWCSFAYEVKKQGGYTYDSSTQTGTFTFSGGGQQCNRQETSHGPTVIENVAEELVSQ